MSTKTHLKRATWNSLVIEEQLSSYRSLTIWKGDNAQIGGVTR